MAFKRLMTVIGGPIGVEETLVPFLFNESGAQAPAGFWLGDMAADISLQYAGLGNISRVLFYTAEEAAAAENRFQDGVPFAEGALYFSADFPTDGLASYVQMLLRRPDGSTPAKNFTMPASGTISLSGFRQFGQSAGNWQASFRRLVVNDDYYVIATSGWERSGGAADNFGRVSGRFDVEIVAGAATMPTLDEYAAATKLSYGREGEEPEDELFSLPFTESAFLVPDPKLFMVNSAGMPVVSWDITSAKRVQLPVSSVELTLANGAVTSGATATEAYLAFSFVRYPPRVKREQLKREIVWADLEELGLTAGLLEIGTEADVEEALPANQVEGKVIMRYRPDLEFAVQVIDDLQRTWTVSASRLLPDRRTVEHTVFRSTLLTA